MGIFSRLSDIVGANLNSVLDRAEDPDKMIRQMIHEMEDTLIEARSSAARLIADRKEIDRRLARILAAEQEWQRKAELAVEKDRADLARAALAEKTRLAVDRKALEQEVEALGDDLGRFETDINKLEQRLRETRAKQKALTNRHITAHQRLRVRRHSDEGRIQEAFARFEQMEQRLDQVQGEVEAYDLGGTPGLAQEIDRLAADSEIEAELEAIRRRLGGRSGESA